MKTRVNRIARAFLLIFACSLSGAAARAQTAYTILHNFGDGTVANDGLSPFGGLVLGPDGNFYGVTAAGGTTTGSGTNGNGFGTAFRMTPTGTVTILHNFDDGTTANDGQTPEASLVLGPDGNFYGTTVAGGSAGGGTIFRMTPTGTVTILHSFGDGTVAGDGAQPVAPLILGVDGNFYGTTVAGGSTAGTLSHLQGYGTLFKMTPTGVVTILHNFGTGAGNGVQPGVGLVQTPDGNIFGTTNTLFSQSLTIPGLPGTVFEYGTDGTFTILHSFQPIAGNAGETPTAGLTEGIDGNLYGITFPSPAANPASIYQVTPARAFTTIFRFPAGSTSTLGHGSIAPLLADTDGYLYGATTGLNGSGSNDKIFRVSPGGTYTLLHDFGSGTPANDGFTVTGRLVDGGDGFLYGTTEQGGSAKFGIAFKVLKPAAASSPAAPTGLTATAGINQVQLSWTASAGAISYDVYRSTTSGAEGSTPLATNVTGTSYVDTAVTAGTKYFYTVAAVNATAGTPSAQSNEASAVPSPPVHTFPAGLQFVSVPFDYTGTPLSDVVDAGDAVLAAWNPSEFQYVLTPTAPADTFHQGQGFWLYAAEPVNIIAQGTDLTAASNTLSLNLPAGWNMIGDPYQVPLPIANLQVVSNGITYTWANAVSSGIVSGTLYSYDPSTGNYVANSNDSLQPYSGYWLFTFRAITLTMPKP